MLINLRPKYTRLNSDWLKQINKFIIDWVFFGLKLIKFVSNSHKLKKYVSDTNFNVILKNIEQLKLIGMWSIQMNFLGLKGIN